MTATPFQMLQLKDRERKIAIQTSIAERNLKNRTISYQGTRDNSKQLKKRQDQLLSDPPKQKYSIKFSKSVRKSFLYRKLLNRSTESHINSEEYKKFKQKLDQLTEKRTIDQKLKFPFYKQIYQNDFNKVNQEQRNEKQCKLSLIIKPSQPKNQQTSFNNFIKTKSKEIQKTNPIQFKQKIAVEVSALKNTQNPQLQVQGNKKTIKYKANNPIEQRTTTAIRKISRKMQVLSKLIEQSGDYPIQQNLPTLSRKNIFMNDFHEQTLPELKESKFIFHHLKQNFQTGTDKEQLMINVSKQNNNVVSYAPGFSCELAESFQLERPTRTTHHICRKNHGSQGANPSSPVIEPKIYYKIHSSRQNRIQKFKQTISHKNDNEFDGWHIKQNQQELLPNSFN